MIKTTLEEYISNCLAEGFNNRTKPIAKYNKSLNDIIQECDEQMSATWDAGTLEIIRESGLSDRYHNFTKQKVNVLLAVVKDFLYKVLDMPFTYNVTDNPTTTPLLKKQLLDELKINLMNEYIKGGMQVTPDALLNIMEQSKMDIKERQKSILDIRLKECTRLIKDWIEESNFKSTFLTLLNDWAIYPFAIMEGGYKVKKNVFKFTKSGKMVATYEDKLAFKNVDIHNVIFALDNPDIQQCKYVILKRNYSKSDLYDMKVDKSYIKGNIKLLIDEQEEGVRFNLDKPRIDYASYYFNNNDDMHDERLNGFKFYGKVKGELLKNYKEYLTNIGDIEKNTYYEVEIDVIEGLIVKIHNDKVSSVLGRPLYACTYSKSTAGFLGNGIAQLMRTSLYMYHTTLRAYILNLSQSSALSYTINDSFVRNFTEDKDEIVLCPSKVTVLSGMPTSQFVAYNTPNHTANLLSQLDYWKNEIDYISGVSGLLHGFPNNTDGKTYRGQIANYANLLKPIQAALYNLDEGVIIPIATRLYYMLMTDNKTDDNIKSDESIIVKGTRGLVEKEIEEKERLDKLASILPLMQLTNNREIIEKEINEIISDITGRNNINKEAVQQSPSINQDALGGVEGDIAQNNRNINQQQR